MALETTPGASDADSYASVAEADAYHASRLWTEAWTDAETTTKEAALKDAARLLDSVFIWTGAAVDAVQALTWPRSGMLTRNGFPIATDVIPPELKNAQSELARLLIVSDRNAENDAEVQGLASVSAGSVSVSFRDRISGLTPAQSLLLRSPDLAYLTRIIPELVRVLLVPSWYEQPTLQDLNSGFMFDAVDI